MDMLAPIRTLIADDFHAVDALIRQQLHTDVALINQIARHIIDGGGKRLRPAVVLLSAQACGYTGTAHIAAAAIVEFIHTATLLHDDVVDGSSLRRGQDTANALWGNQVSVLVGDFIYTRAFQMMVGIGSLRVMDIFADTTNAIAEGEVLQLLHCHDPDVTEAGYMTVVDRKTARLFAAATRLGAVLAEQPPDVEQALAAYGEHLGVAFQLVDDLLDYTAGADWGKNIGDDLAGGTPTLPLIYALRTGAQEAAAVIREAIIHGERAQFAEIMQMVESTGALEYTARLAVAQSERAITSLAVLADSPAKNALIDLARFAVHRTH